MNPIIARFNDEPSLVNPEQRAWFEACLRETADTPLPVVNAGDDFWGPEDEASSWLRPYVVTGGVLLIPVKGVLLNDFPFQLGSYATGYEYIAATFERGLADPAVQGIALICDSPGGMVAGCFDLVDTLHAGRGAKPITAFAHESAYSAAYAVASAADRIVVSRSGGVGSIGVLTMHVDVSKMLDEAGIKVTLIYAGAHKVDGNPFEALPEAVRERTQVVIDSIYQEFVATVARNRSMDEQAVRDTEAECFMAAESLTNGLADEIGPLAQSLAAFAASLEINHGETEMADEISQTDVDAARTAGLAEGASAERTRITAILGADVAKPRARAALSAALKTSMTADQAIAFLSDIPEEKVEAAAAPAEATGAGAPRGMFEAAMAGSKSPDLGTGDDDEEQMSVADRILASAGKTRRRA